MLQLIAFSFSLSYHFPFENRQLFLCFFPLISSAVTILIFKKITIKKKLQLKKICFLYSSFFFVVVVVFNLIFLPFYTNFSPDSFQLFRPSFKKCWDYQESPILYYVYLLSLTHLFWSNSPLYSNSFISHSGLIFRLSY